MGRRTKHISAGEGGRGGPVLDRIENGPQRVYHEKRGGPDGWPSTHNTRGETGEIAGPVAYIGCGCTGRNADGEEKDITRGDGL